VEDEGKGDEVEVERREVCRENECGGREQYGEVKERE
jgi:hypothetical protein